MLKIMRVLLIVLVCALMLGCYTFNHQVGEGSQTGVEKTQKEWFLLWGLVPLKDVDSKAMAGDAVNYEVKTQMSVEDVLISIITGWATIYPQTVTVTK